MEINIKDNLKMILEMARASMSGPMVIVMMVCGLITNSMAKAYINIKMEIGMKGSLKMIK